MYIVVCTTHVLARRTVHVSIIHIMYIMYMYMYVVKVYIQFSTKKYGVQVITVKPLLLVTFAERPPSL